MAPAHGFLLTSAALAFVALCSNIDKCKQHIVLHIDQPQGHSTSQHLLHEGSHNPLVFLPPSSSVAHHAPIANLTLGALGLSLRSIHTEVFAPSYVPQPLSHLGFYFHG